VPELIRFVSDAKSARQSTSTQEDAWMVLAARAIAAGNRSISVNVNGQAYAGAYETRLSGETIRDRSADHRQSGALIRWMQLSPRLPHRRSL
jgi:uncharacterized protein YfaS (alpha-2-macroglobulin family)